MKKNMKKQKMLAVLLTIILSLISFETALAANPVTVNIPVYKEISGDVPTQDEMFSFRLAAIDDAPMPAGSVNGVKTLTISGVGGTFFGMITYMEPGEYHYFINEVNDSNAAYTYDKTVYHLTVYIIRNKESGDMQAVMVLVKQGSEAKQERAVFINQYTCPEVNVDPTVRKVISGDTPPADSTFTFYMRADEITYPMPAGTNHGVKRMTITGAGIEDFGNITYTETGTYTYTVYEHNGSVSGYTYDTTVYTMTVTVTEENGVLSAAREIKDQKGVSVPDLIFTNQYLAAPSPSPTVTATPTSIPTSPGKTDGPKTGDDSIDYIWWILLGIAVFGIGAALYCRRKGV